LLAGPDLHRIEVVASHVAQLAAPLVLLAPQPAGTVAAAVIVACSVVDTSLAGHLLPLPAPPALAPAPPWYEGLVIAYAVAVLALSYRPARNLISRRQLMNASFDQFHLVNTYGAFGSISRYRCELVIEGTADLAPDRRRSGWSTSSRASRATRSGTTSGTSHPARLPAPGR
jgi:hypothetical protein